MAEEEGAAAIFLAELKLIKDTLQSKPSIMVKLGPPGRRCPIESTFRELQKRHQGIKHGRPASLWYSIAMMQAYDKAECSVQSKEPMHSQKQNKNYLPML